MITLEGATCVRRDGKLVIEIPEQSLVDMVTKPNPAFEVQINGYSDRETFLKQVVSMVTDRVYEINYEATEPKEQSLHHFIRDVCDRTATWLLEGDELDMQEQTGDDSSEPESAKN